MHQSRTALAEAAAAPPFHRRGTLPTSLAVLALALALLWPALVNGPLPLVFPDSIDYLTNGRDLRLGVTRPPGYAYAILPLWRALGGLPAGLWAVAGAQALLAAWMVWLTLDLALDRPDDDTPARWTLLVATPVLAGATALPFFASWVMADALTAPTLLAAALLALFWPRLRRRERVVLLTLLSVGAAAHQTHAVLGLAAGATALLLQAAGPARMRGAWRGALLAIVAPLLALGAVVALNRAVHGHADTAQASPAFLLARLVGDDLVAPHAAALCAERPAAPLCLRRDWLGPGRKVDELLWEPASPLWVDYHGFEAIRDDARWLAWRVLRLEWPAALGNGLARAAHLLTALRLPELDLRPMAEPLMSGLAHHLPELVVPVGGSGQLSGALARHAVARLAPAAMLGGCLVLFTLVPVLLRRGAPGGALGALVLAGMAANALVVGLTAEAYDRYQARLGWLPVLVVVAAVARLSQANWTWLPRRP
jgi:hypothetical protein